MTHRPSPACTLTGVIVLAIGACAAQAGDDDGALPDVRSRARHQELPRPEGLPSDTELEAAGALIGRIDIVPQPIFDTSLPEERVSIFRIANRLHVRTHPGTLGSQLLFRSGDRYSARRLRETERILRSTRYLYDASIRPVAYRDGKVDIEVRTRDVWSLNPGLSFGRSGGENTSGLEFEELNLLGTGSQLSLGYTSGVDRDSTTLLYKDRQLGSSWWGVAAQLSQNSDGSAHALTLERPFYALDARWAASFSLRNDDRIATRYDLGESVGEFRAQQRFVAVSAGVSTGLVDGWTQRWTAGWTYDESRFRAIPDVALAGDLPSDRRLVYPWIGYERIQDRYLTARNRDQIERTEDFDLGWHFSARLGWAGSATGADRNAVIFAGAVGKGYEPTARQTWLFDSSIGGRLEEGILVNTLADVSARYYFRQSPHRLLFAKLSADATGRLDPDAQLLLGGDNGLRGYPLRYQGGEGRWLFTAEQRWFTNWYPFRLFHVGGAVFFDAGRTWGDNPFGTRSQGVLKDVGLGLRLGNSRSALGNVLHIDLAMPLDGDPSIGKVQLLIDTKHSF